MIQALSHEHEELKKNLKLASSNQNELKVTHTIIALILCGHKISDHKFSSKALTNTCHTHSILRFNLANLLKT